MVDGGEPGVDSRDEGKHTGRNVFKVQLLCPSSLLDAMFTKIDMNITDALHNTPNPLTCKCIEL